MHKLGAKKANRIGSEWLWIYLTSDASDTLLGNICHCDENKRIKFILKPPKKKVLNHAVAISADLLITCFPIYDKTGFKNWHFSLITQSFRPTRSREKEVNSWPWRAVRNSSIFVIITTTTIISSFIVIIIVTVIFITCKIIIIIINIYIIILLYLLVFCSLQDWNHFGR